MYKIDSYKEPFWAENSGFMTGRDPLGIQNSSITTYARLLPGMTNLTLRLRYYGFYMWLINEFYKKNEGRTDFTHREQYNFIRRGELIIAYLMRKKAPRAQSIIGSNFTDNHEDDTINLGYYNIQLGADKLKNTIKGSVYWDFRSGALGQYYSGALSALKLINNEGQFFQMEERGNRLALAFSEAVDIKHQNKFLEIIENGKLYLKDFEYLDDFQMTSIEPYSQEWNLYLEILINFDGMGFEDTKGNNTFMRKETIKLLLEYFNQDIKDYNERSFIQYQFDLNQNKLNNGASFGWYYYYLNEAFHIALEGVFWSLLVNLDGKPKEVESFIDNLMESVLCLVEEELKIDRNDNVLEIINLLSNKEISLQLDDLHSLYKKIENSSNTLYSSLMLMMLIYRDTEKIKEQIIDFENQYKIVFQKGRVSENIKIFIEDSLSASFKEFAQNTIKTIMNDHVNTAYRKMGNGESNLLKFIIEDGIISHIQTMQPRHTSPRLRTITNFLEDLSLVDSNHKVTEVGNEILNKL